MEISKSDWKLFRARIAEWQEDYMERLVVKPQIISGDFRRLYKVEIPVTVCG